MMTTTEKLYIRVLLLTGDKILETHLAKVKWIENRCSDYKFVSATQNSIPYAVFLTEQDHMLFKLRWS